MYNRRTEIRRLAENDLNQLAEVLDENDWWEDLMLIIPKRINTQECSEDGQLNWEQAWAAAGGIGKYTRSEVALIRKATERLNESRLSAKILLTEWSTSGRKEERPTLGYFLQLLLKAELYKVAEFVAVKLLGEPPPQRPSNGPAARIDLSFETQEFHDIHSVINDSSYFPGTETLQLNANYRVDNNDDYCSKYINMRKDIFLNKETQSSPPTSPLLNHQEAPKAPPRKRRSTQNGSSAQVERASLVATSTGTAAENETRSTQMTHLSSERVEQKEVQHCNEESELNQSCQSGQISQNLPNISALWLPSTESKSQNDMDNLIELSQESLRPKLSLLLTSEATSTTSATAETNGLHHCNNTTDGTHEYEDSNDPHGNGEDDSFNLPNVSELNLNGDRSESGERPWQEQQRRHSLGSHSDTSSSSCLSHVDEEDEDDEDYDIDDGNLPISELMNKRSSSNNDSSLTNITGTSGDNSFELNDCSSTSNENIPTN